MSDWLGSNASEDPRCFVYMLDRGSITLSGPVEEIRGRLDEIEAAHLSRL